MGRGGRWVPPASSGTKGSNESSTSDSLNPLYWPFQISGRFEPKLRFPATAFLISYKSLPSGPESIRPTDYSECPGF